MTFQNNVAATSHADWGGGAIYGGTGVFTIRRSTFIGNRGANGGAIGTIAVQITIEDSRFENNATLPVVGDPFNGGEGGHGGAIYIDGTNLGALTLRRTVFSGNRATNLGGAIHSWMYGLPSAFVIEDCTFANNVGTTNGGAIFHMNGRLTISGSTFSGNTVVGQGGALWEGEADPGQTPVSITNSTFTGNSATGIRPNSGSTGLGGAIRDNGNPTTLTHLTIVGNHADWVGGGIVGREPRHAARLDRGRQHGRQRRTPLGHPEELLEHARRRGLQPAVAHAQPLGRQRQEVRRERDLPAAAARVARRTTAGRPPRSRRSTGAPRSTPSRAGVRRPPPTSAGTHGPTARAATWGPSSGVWRRTSR